MRLRGDTLLICRDVLHLELLSSLLRVRRMSVRVSHADASEVKVLIGRTHSCGL